MENNNTILEVPDNGPGGPVPGGKVEQKPQLDPVEQSAAFINQAHQEFKRVAYALADKKKRSAARVLEAVLFEPLEAVPLMGKAEEELLVLANQIMYHKGVMLRYAMERFEKKKKGELNESEEKMG